jgi:hypothetical protein
MADLAQLGLSLDAKPLLTGLEAVDQALAKTAAAAGDLVGKIKTATGQMAAAFKSVGAGGLAGQLQQQHAKMVGGFQVANSQIRSIISDRVRQATAEAVANDKIRLNSAILTGKLILAEEKTRAAELAKISAARAKAASDARLTPASGNVRIDATREALARLRIEEAALHQQMKAGDVTRREYAQRMREITRETNLAVAGNSRARGVFRQTASAIASATFEITGAVFGLTAAFGALAAPGAFGFKLLSTLEDTRLGLSGILISMGEINGEAIKLPKALELADGITKRLQENALKFGVDLIALADTTKAVLASGLGGGLALREVEELALLGSIAVKTIGLDARQSVQEIRDLVAGGIQAGSSTLAVALGVTNEDVKRWRETGTLFDNLKVKLKGFQDTAILKQDTLNGAWTIFVQKIQLLLANGPAFDLIKQKLTDISNAVGGFNADTGQFEFNPELVKTVEEYYAAFKTVVEVLADAGRLIVQLIPLVIELGKAFLLLKAINLSGTLAKGLLEVGVAATSATKAIITGAGGAKNKVDELTGAFNKIGNNPIVQVIGVELAFNFGQFVGGKLNEFFGDFFAKELEKINKLIYNFGDNLKATLADALAAVFQWGPISRLLGIPEFFSNMADEIRRGSGKATEAAAAQAGRIARISAQYDSVQSEGGLRSTGKINGGGDRLLAEEKALLGEDIVTGKRGTTDPGKPARARSGGGGGVDPSVAFLAGLRKEVDTLGLSEEAIRRYELSKMKLSATNRRLAEQQLNTIFGFKAEQEAAKVANEEVQKRLDAEEEQIKAAEDLTAETRKGLEQIEFETSLLSLNTEERYKALAAQELSANAHTKENAALIENVALLKKKQEQQSRINSLLANTQGAKTQDFQDDIAAADAAFFSGDIGPGQHEEIIKSVTDGTKDAKDKLNELDQFTKTLAENMQNSLAEFFFDPFKDGLDGMLRGFGTLIQKMVAEAAAAQVTQALFGKAAGGEGTGFAGEALSFFGSLFTSANGNAFSGGQPQAFASGGILGASGGMLTRPTLFPMANGGLGLGGEAGVEAVMPLKRGRDGKLGVASGGGGQSSNITVIVQGGQSAPDVRRAAGQGAREALGLMRGAQRYA